MAQDPQQDLRLALERMGLLHPGEAFSAETLSGGVSSDILRISLPGRTPALNFCFKRALAKLKVAAEWRAPVERNHAEVEWMRVAGELAPGCVPHILGEDAQAGAFAMEYLEPAEHPVWKNELRDGDIRVDTAAAVARIIAAIHAGTALRADIAQRFANDHIFHPIRLEPYLLATAARHPDCAARLYALAETTARTKLALVHGDLSPKNILVAARGPILLDAECAWYGDPAFDLAFCLNHMLLKCLWRPQWRGRYLACYDALASTYLARVAWEPRAAIEARVAHLLPGLFLGRVDGKSPAEYLSCEGDKEAVRRVARRFLLEPADRLAAIRDAWNAELQRT
ncbi:MAG TPA: phosphotransferase [Burkholderiales bacterium]|nr:phosphotransferase [Burkholderiales bacterium]